MKVKTSELTGAVLDWAVANCLGHTVAENYGSYIRIHLTDTVTQAGYTLAFCPSTDWAHGGPIIEREGINIEFDPDVPQWFASYDRGEVVCGYSGLMPLIAAMRCYVASKLGDEVEVPNEMAS